MGLFRSNHPLLPDFSAIGTDLHSHLLPGLDDGAATLAESLRIISEMEALGFRKMITTPHVIADMYPNTKETIMGQGFHLTEVLEESRRAEGQQGRKESCKVEVSGEYHMDGELMERVRGGEVIPFGKEDYLLIELPWHTPRFSYEDILRQIQELGYQPIVAHPERYPWMMGNMKMYRRLIDMGMIFQLNLNSLSGLYGFPSKIAAQQLIDAELIGFAGSDIHYMGHVVELRKVLQSKHLVKLIDSGNLLNGEL